METEFGQICEASKFVSLTERNVLRQFDEIRRVADPCTPPLDVATILRLHAIACEDIYNFGGRLRDRPVTISGTTHQPPPPETVSGHVDAMVAYTVANWHRPAAHLCSYLLWRCNWIHPFPNANGRTSRGVAYLAFIRRAGFEPPGAPTFIDMIAEHKQPYYDALDAADAAWLTGAVNVSEMEKVVTNGLMVQLRSAGVQG